MADEVRTHLIYMSSHAPSVVDQERLVKVRQGTAFVTSSLVRCVRITFLSSDLNPSSPDGNLRLIKKFLGYVEAPTPDEAYTKLVAHLEIQPDFVAVVGWDSVPMDSTHVIVDNNKYAF